MSTSLIRLPRVLEKTGEGRSTTFNKIKAGTHPKPVRLGPNSVAFVEAEIDEYIANKIAERDALRKAS